MKILLLHGFHGHADVYFLPFLRDLLAPYGEVFCPSLPEPAKPQLKAWMEAVETWSRGESIGLTVAHSLGGTLAMSMISQGRLDTRHLVCIGSSAGPKDEPEINHFVEPPIAMKALRSLESFYVVSSYDDPWTHPEYSTLLIKQAGAVGLFYGNQGHFETHALPIDVLELLKRLAAGGS